MSMEQRLAGVRVFDNDLEGSCGLHHIRKKHPEIYSRGGIMERGNFSAAAGFGSSAGKQGIFGTFSAFLEMCVSEITMARLNFSNVLAHFSHSGVDDMGDNTCHFGINSMFADGGLTPSHSQDTTRLYFPVDQHQFTACVKRIYQDPGLRFVFSTRAPVPDILDSEGKPLYQGRPFEPGKDYIVRESPAGGGYVIATGETVYRALDAVISLQEKGIRVGLINKPTLNVVDAEMMTKLSSVPFVLVVEGWNAKTGLGSRFGSYLLQAGFSGKYNHVGTHKEGCAGQWQQMGYQGLDPRGIAASMRRFYDLSFLAEVAAAPDRQIRVEVHSTIAFRGAHFCDGAGFRFCHRSFSGTAFIVRMSALADSGERESTVAITWSAGTGRAK
ncbi:MAG: transketolase C-terminal domain-containing protein [Steroidobacteraceae bacterium]